ncbi:MULTISPECIES: hypothetical protein [unclassified Burkholderia]|uniref:hypothetical protein n=1 Tax=unclassified Burkholderia TaxID=2613784 RepID=UPI001E38484B|nr:MULTISPECIES: hypothetical protein [unclassified Burkholderia]UEP32443.1 hypothetical protein LMA01_33895 [Burkholderia sp. B21-007]UEP46499.1 hypothetical protein LMA02_32380 [Burkholderia sp. B21-005]
MKPASESKAAARRIAACAAVALLGVAPAAWAQNSQRPGEGTGAPILSPPDDTSAQGTSGMSNGNTAAPATRMQAPRGASPVHPPVRTKPGGPSGAGTGGSGSTGGGGTAGGSVGSGGAGSSGY